MVETAANGTQGLAAAARENYDLVLLDVAMPDMNGVEVLARLRQQHKQTNLKVIMFSGHTTPEEMSDMLSRGADDFLTKPFSVAQLLARVQNMLRLKAAQDKAGMLNHSLMHANSNLQENLKAASGDVNEVRNALVLTLARLIEQRDGRGPGHIVRMRKYCRALATNMGKSGPYAHIIDDQFIDWLECCSPLHDIGKVGLPDHVLTKVGALAPEERAVMEAHTIIAADALKEILQENGVALNFLQTAVDITRSHHERHDGNGYPDRLAGDSIPLAARIVSICDVYDALRCRRLYKPSLPHPAALQIITQKLHDLEGDILSNGTGGGTEEEGRKTRYRSRSYMM